MTLRSNSSRFRAHHGDKLGLSLIDLLVLLAILGVVATLVIWRMAGSRASSRRMECESNLRNVFLAMESYSLRYGQFPIGTQSASEPVRSITEGYHHNWAEGLLPMLNEPQLFEQIDFDFGVYAPENAPVAQTQLPTLRCPASVITLAMNSTAYAGVTSSVEEPIASSGDGMFVANRGLGPNDAADGQSYVFLVGEKSIDFGSPVQFNSGTRTSLRSAGHRINTSIDESNAKDPLFVGGFSSNHVGGAYFLFVDGSFQFLADETDATVLRQMASRDDQAAERAEASQPASK